MHVGAYIPMAQYLHGVYSPMCMCTGIILVLFCSKRNFHNVKFTYLDVLHEGHRVHV